jgi:hypothetical protein
MLAASVNFLTPLASLVGLVALVGIAVVLSAENRSRRVARALGLVPKGPLAGIGAVVAIAASGILIGVAAAQPVVSDVGVREGRTDVEAIFVFDISRSMLARHSRTGPTRFERATEAGKELRSRIPTVPVGVSSITDRLLPHLFPTTSANVFTSTLDRAMGVERPPPDRSGRGRVTALAALQGLVTGNFYGPKATKRIAVVFSDAETVPVDIGTLRGRLLGKVDVVFVRLWSPSERVYLPDGQIERQYRPDLDSGDYLAGVAEAIEADVFEEDELEEVAGRVQALVGKGPTGPAGEELESRPLAAYVVGAAFLPILLLLARRNL